MVSVIVLFFVLVVGSSTAKVPTERTNHYVGPLPKAYGSPLNVDQKVDCAVKVLAWEYAKKIQPRVSPFMRDLLLGYTLKKNFGDDLDYGVIKGL